MSSLPDPHPRLRLRDVRRSFLRGPVLDGVDLDVLAGQTVLLAGDNGSGKTTLLRCIAGLARCEGRIVLDGEPCGGSPATRAAVGYLPQTLGFPTWPTAAEVLALFERLRGSPATDLSLPEGFLPPLDQPVGHLSGGQRQRLAIVTAMLGHPRLLLLDEPAANLDADGRAGLADLLVGVAATGTSTLIAAPSPGDLGLVPDRVVHLVDGRVVAGPRSLDRLDLEASGPRRAPCDEEAAS
jgi:ABC-type multidrug transport system ATPase subunit